MGGMAHSPVRVQNHRDMLTPCRLAASELQWANVSRETFRKGEVLVVVNRLRATLVLCRLIDP